MGYATLLLLSEGTPQPWVVQHLSSRWTLLRVLVQHPLDEVLCALPDVGREVHRLGVLFPDVREYLVLVLGLLLVEWGPPGQQFESQHPQRPHIYLAVVLLPPQHFGRHVICSPAESLFLFLLGSHGIPSGPAEVSQLDLAIGQENVLGFDVSVHDPGPLEVVENLGELGDELFHGVLFDASVLIRE